MREPEDDADRRHIDRRSAVRLLVAAAAAGVTAPSVRFDPFSPVLTAQAPGGGARPLPVDNPTQDAAWMTEELILARKYGNLGCIVSASANTSYRDVARY